MDHIICTAKGLTSVAFPYIGHCIKYLFFSFFAFTFVSCQKQPETLFEEQKSEVTGIDFANNIIENDTLNYYTFPYLYMGGGVAVGDLNNDGLEDVFFTGNMQENKLYLNQGKTGNGSFSFQDISKNAGVAGDNRWYAGVTMADVNADGWLDIYVCVSGKYTTTKNQLFINNHDLTFTEQAEEYGLADASNSIQATFFDYDKDGLLDVFVANYPVINVSVGNDYYYRKIQENKPEESGHLYRNTGNNTFKDVTVQAGMQRFGLSLGVIAQDFNGDGHTDLYVSNDFNVPDYFYLNNGDGTFTESLQETMRQTSQFGMGVDAGDFDNDGLTDLMQVDMTPADYKRAKTNMASMSPATFYQMVDYGFHYQYMQNSLQHNNGIDALGMPQFSNVARLTGVATTDWSWGTLLADLDNDGRKDILVTNGMRRDVNNNDINEKFKDKTFFTKNENFDYQQLPSTPIDNYAFRNEGDLRFREMTTEWGLNYAGFSNGVAYADFDNDGDLDLVINNIDQKASVFENKAEEFGNNYLKLKLKGPQKNPFGLDSKVSLILADDTRISWQLTLSRGFQSSVAPSLTVGLGKNATLKRVKVAWPDGRETILQDIAANQLLEINYANSVPAIPPSRASNVFTDLTEVSGLNFTHQEDDFDDYAEEPLLPHRNSRFGPALAVGDVNNDGLEDFFVGNAAGSTGRMFLQNHDGTFAPTPGPWEKDAAQEDTGALLFDADGDGDLDLYVVSGGNDSQQSVAFYQDRLYIQTKNGFVKSSLPAMPTSGQKVIAGDYDNDGDLDLFVSGRVVPGRYPHSPRSYLLKNNGGKDLALRFSDRTDHDAPDLKKIGLVTSAVWLDFDKDGQQDLVVAGEWMPLRFFKNKNGRFNEVTEATGLQNTEGWWYGLTVADVDQDGDDDIIAGNLGLNYKYHASEASPFEIYVNDFDENQHPDIVLSYEKKGKKLPLRGRQCSSQQVPAISKRFESYASFADASLEDIYTKPMLEKSLHFQAFTFAHAWIENLGNGHFASHELGRPAQVSSINQIIPFSYNQDKYPDFLLAGNLYGSEVETPRNDASVGMIMEGGKSGIAKYVTARQSGLFLKGDVRGLLPIKLGKSRKQAFLVAANGAQLRLVGFQPE
ncbi:VCBS repeat-containing protein [Persicitalea jodogahamensis]|uniref:ASPIC/UnbV domain-containing protein n=1 Tax=Persicitalea jodogahamensis TaxID=402147 RepID=A0A8J3D817_9BACT|nr:FG-GAP-like repeat-containing protein [Persicitalea jodogahamensis]GHB63672.1 hypothetical protein GCM10007390_16880 [Persicitalea jodogahamensis]